MSHTTHHPLPVGTRVHHRGGRYSVSYYLHGPDDTGNRNDGGPYWGVIVGHHERNPFSDGSYEYLVQRDAPHVPGARNEPTWWASYRIDRVLPQHDDAYPEPDNPCTVCHGEGAVGTGLSSSFVDPTDAMPCPHCCGDGEEPDLGDRS